MITCEICGDVDAACGDVGGDENVVLPVAEAVDRFLAPVLRHVALQRRDPIAALVQVSASERARRLVRVKIEHALGRRLLQHRQQQLGLQAIRHRIERVRDGLGRRDHADLHRDRVFQNVAGQAADVVRHGGREEERLALAPADA